MVRSNASPVLGAGQSRLSHPRTRAKSSESASATCGQKPEVDKVGCVCLSSGLFSEGLEFRAGGGGALHPVAARSTRFEWSVSGRPVPRA
jgi:hypothetical protein